MPRPVPPPPPLPLQGSGPVAGSASASAAASGSASGSGSGPTLSDLVGATTFCAFCRSLEHTAMACKRPETDPDGSLACLETLDSWVRELRLRVPESIWNTPTADVLVPVDLASQSRVASLRTFLNEERQRQSDNRWTKEAADVRTFVARWAAARLSNGA
ncbi:hypothetical protein DFJ73DRAFT_851680 [Zopfochytrium polystomum]|nr:hypothetical protein DFJ73DRAFT_851680 [Zopfochytrium polystomum]